MKTLSLFFLSLTLLTLSCKKEKVDQLSLLPAATQTGANRLGALVNGRAFVPENQSLISGPMLKCQYGYFGKYIFTLSAGAKPGDGTTNGVSIATDSLKLTEGATIPLTQTSTPGMASAGYSTYSKSSLSALGKNFTTNATATGQLTITHLDTVNLIVSGTFQFTAVAADGETVSITNGRFDLRYMP
jgi:hypothetical protein